MQRRTGRCCKSTWRSRSCRRRGRAPSQPYRTTLPGVTKQKRKGIMSVHTCFRSIAENSANVEAYRLVKEAEANAALFTDK